MQSLQWWICWCFEVFLSHSVCSHTAPCYRVRWQFRWQGFARRSWRGWSSFGRTVAKEASATHRERHMRANRTEYLFSVNPRTPPRMTVDSGDAFTVEVRGAFDDVQDISAVPTVFTP